MLLIRGALRVYYRLLRCPDREYKDFMKYLREKSSADLPPAPKKKKGKKAAAKDEL